MSPYVLNLVEIVYFPIDFILCSLTLVLCSANSGGCHQDKVESSPFRTKRRYVITLSVDFCVACILH